MKINSLPHYGGSTNTTGLTCQNIRLRLRYLDLGQGQDAGIVDNVLRREEP